MAVSIDWPTGVITIPRADMTLVQSVPFEVRELNLEAFREELRALEDDAAGMPWPKTHNHNTTVTLSGTIYARVIEIVNGYTVTFEDGSYAVDAKGANSNIADVLNLNNVQLRTANSAGLIVTAGGSGGGLTQDDLNQIIAAINSSTTTINAHTTAEVDAIPEPDLSTITTAISDQTATLQDHLVSTLGETPITIDNGPVLAAITSHNDTLDNIEAVTTAANLGIAGVNTRLDTQTTILDDIDVALTVQQSSLSGIGSKVDTAQTSLNNIVATQSAHTAALNTIDTNLSQSLVDIASVYSFMSTYQPDFTPVLDSLTTETTALTVLLNSITSDVSDLYAYNTTRFDSVDNAIAVDTARIEAIWTQLGLNPADAVNYQVEATWSYTICPA